MRRFVVRGIRIRVVWLILLILAAFLLGFFIRPMIVTEEPQVAGATTTVEPLTPTIQAKPTLVSTQQPAPDVPTVNPTVVPATDQTAPAPTTATTVAPTNGPKPTTAPAVKPSATTKSAPSPTPTLTPVPATAADAVLNTSDVWAGTNGLTLALKPDSEQPHSSGDRVAITFVVVNTGSQTLDFSVPMDSFYIQLSDGQKFMAQDTDKTHTSIQVNDLKPAGDKGHKDRKEITVDGFQLNWNDFQAAKANKDIISYTIGVTDFGDGIPLAQWQMKLSH